ncbi:MAG: radical SAM protein [Pseudomonadota bacterium]
MTTLESLCPVCLKKIPARRREQDDLVAMVKTCPEHGEFQAKIWRGPPAFSTWKRPKTPTVPPFLHKETDRGCPFDCGLCPEHRQRSCAIVLEVARGCNLECPVCFADARKSRRPEPTLSTIEGWYESARRAAGDCNIQLSGGEPTIRDDLPEIVRLGREHGFSFIQVNTNGLRPARDDDYVKDLKDAGLSSVFLQFDGTTDRVYEIIRGKKLLAEKMKAIETFGRHGLGVVLVPTLIPGINDGEVGNILRTAVGLSPVVRAVHFQPFSNFGRTPFAPTDENRLTLPELLRLIEGQTGGDFRVEHFHPPGCENALCSFSATYLVEPGGRVRALAPPFNSCRREPEPAEQGALRAISRVAGQWSAPSPDFARESPSPASPPSSPCCAPGSGLVTLDDFLARARTHTLSVSAMAFQDAWTLDLERLRDCCIHVMAHNGDLIPFCAYNLTAADGRRLYRR